MTVVFRGTDFSQFPVIRAEANNPARRGEPASKKVLFGDACRYAVYAIHTRFDAVCWIVQDAQERLNTIRLTDTLAEAVSGLLSESITEAWD
jgi:hypothetical protein